MKNIKMSKIRSLRIEIGMTQAALAEKAGIKQPTMCVIEQNGVRSIDSAKKFGEILKVDPMDVLEI